MGSRAEAAPRPALVLAMGDPAGISPELTAKVLADEQVRAAAQIIVIGDRRVLGEGERVARADAGVTVWRPGAGPLELSGGPVLIDLGHLDPATVTRGEATAKGGTFALANFRLALALAAAGGADAVTFTPFNKFAMRQAHAGYEDEIEIIAEATQGRYKGREFNILEGLWNARVTSHVPLKDVSRYITREAVLGAIVLTDQCMREAGFERPRIAVAGLNPHAGDNGNFGREEIDEIAPAVADAKARGISCEGPYPSDTVFMRARRGEFDAVQTMYHDQGQIAMKLIGFEQGITLIGGYPFPVCTPAHGTAYDIAGKGIAHVGATRNALLIAARMARPQPMESARRGALLAELLANRAQKVA